MRQEEEYSEIRGRRKYCRSKGHKPFTREFRKCVQGQRKQDKGKSRNEKKRAAKERREAYNEALVRGKIRPTFLDKIAGAGKKVTLAPTRGSFSALVRLNVFGLASKLQMLKKKAPKSPKAKKGWIKAKATWLKFGGNLASLEKSIRKGAVKKPIAAKIPKEAMSGVIDTVEENMDIPYRTPVGDIHRSERYLMEANKLYWPSQEGYSGFLGLTEEYSNLTPEVWTAIGASLPILAEIVAILTQNKGEVGDLDMDADDQTYLNQRSIGLTTEEAEQIVKEEETKILGMNPFVFATVVAVGFVGGYLIYRSVKAKGKAKAQVQA